MTTLNLDELCAHMDRSNWKSLHDCTYAALYQMGHAPVGGKVHSAVLVEVLRRLPEHIRASALRWGFGDTVIADNVIRYVREQSQNSGSFEAWIASAVE